MRIGWLADKHNPPGGAELSQAEFRSAAPDGVEVVDCPPGRVDLCCDRYALNNLATYSWEDYLRVGGRRFKYHHDSRVALDPRIREEVSVASCPIYCSPLQREAMKLDGDYAAVIPPALDLAALRPNRQQRRHGERKGACCIGAFLNPGKAGYRVAVWADENEPVDAYGYGPFLPEGPNVNYCGPLEPAQLAQTLWQYERFVYLPTALEPFGRCVVEAWAAGCEVITNDLVGARYWIEEAPEKLETAAEDFWKVVLS